MGKKCQVLYLMDILFRIYVNQQTIFRWCSTRIAFLIERTRANPKSCYRARNRIKKRERGAPSVVVLFRDQQFLSIEEGWSVDGRGDMSSPSYSVTIGRRRWRRRLRSTLLLREDRGRRMEREEILLCPIVDLLSSPYIRYDPLRRVFSIGKRIIWSFPLGLLFHI